MCVCVCRVVGRTRGALPLFTVNSTLAGINFLFHMYFLVRYSRNLEEGSFRGRPADYIMFLLFGAVLMTVRVSHGPPLFSRVEEQCSDPWCRGSSRRRWHRL